MTDEQALTLARLMRDYDCTYVSIMVQPFDLPADYVLANIRPRSGNELQFGIAPNGDASS